MGTNSNLNAGDLFKDGPPIRLQRSLGLIRDDSLRSGRRAIYSVLIAWAPMAVLALVEGSHSVFVDAGVYARYLVAVPALILAEADCLPALGRIAQHFATAGFIIDSDRERYESAISSTRRLIHSAIGDIIAIAIAYAAVFSLMVQVAPHAIPEWHRLDPTGFPSFSLTGWWHAAVSLPILLVLVVGWLFRLALWARFLLRIARLNLNLVAAHPDQSGGLQFVGWSLRHLRLVSLGLAAIAAGHAANSVLYRGSTLSDLTNLLLAVVVFVLLITAGPLTVFLWKLQELKRQGILEYGALARHAGESFEKKWISRRNPDVLETANFSATTDLYSIVKNVYEIRYFPFAYRELVFPVGAAMIPFVPIVVLSVPINVITDTLAKFFL